MKNISGFLKSALTIFLLGILFFSCKKEKSQIGIDLVGGNPLNVIFSDTASVEVYSILRDSIRTDELSYNMVGVVIDPVFGTTKASLYTQYGLTLSNYSFGVDQVFDSLVLSIPYQSIPVYGDSMSPLSFKVYELDEMLYLDSSYYSNNTAAYLPELLGELTIIPKPFTRVLVDTTEVEPFLSLRLSDELGKRLLALDDTIFYNTSDFLEEFNGLYIEPVYAGGTGNLTFLNLKGARSKLTLYYNNSLADSLSYSFVMNASSPSFQNFDHMGYAGSDPDFYRQVIEKDTLLGEQKFYLQSLGGVESYIRFPSLFNHADFTNYAINEAKLIITNIDPDNMFIQPTNMLLLQKRYSSIDSLDNYYFIEDTGGGDTYFNGSYNSATKEYEFRITKYMQDYISGKFESDNVLMQIAGYAYRGVRLIAGGSNPDINQESRIRLEMIYTEIKTDNQ